MKSRMLSLVNGDNTTKLFRNLKHHITQHCGNHRVTSYYMLRMEMIQVYTQEFTLVYI